MHSTMKRHQMTKKGNNRRTKRNKLYNNEKITYIGSAIFLPMLNVNIIKEKV